MWFKNIRILAFSNPIDYSPDELSNSLSQLTFRPCLKTLASSYGWIAPIGDNDQAPLVHGQNGFMLIRLRIEEKVLPASVLREHLNAEIKKLEEKSGRKVYKDEKERLKDEIYQTLLAQAFSKSSYINGYIDTHKNWLVVDCASSKKLAIFVSLFNKCTDNSPYAAEFTSVPGKLTHWLMNDDYPSSLCLANACLLKEPEEDGSVVRFKNQDLSSEKVQCFLKDGSVANQLSLEWCDQIRFTMKEDFGFSSVKFLEAIKELAMDGMSETKEQRLASDFLIMAKTLQQFLAEMLILFQTEEAAIFNEEPVEA